MLKKTKLVPIVKLSKENRVEISKFRPVSLLKVGGKIIDKVLINRIMHHVVINH